MIGFRRSVLTAAVLLALSGGAVHAALVELKKGGETEVTANEVYEKEGVVRIDVRNKPLKDVLQAVENISGINVSLDDSLMDIPVDADIRDKEWHLALQQLLKDFNIVFNFIDSQITGLKVLSLHGVPDEKTTKSAKSDAADASKEVAKLGARGKGGARLGAVERSGGAEKVETDELGRPVLTEGEYLGDTRVKIRRSYPEGFRVSVMPPTHPPGFNDNTPPPGAENTLFRPPLPTPTVKPSKDVDNTPPPGSTS